MLVQTTRSVSLLASVITNSYSETDCVCLQVVIGPATVGGIQAGAFKIGDTAGTIDNIIQCKLYRPGSVGFVSKSVCDYLSELYNAYCNVCHESFYLSLFSFLVGWNV